MSSHITNKVIVNLKHAVTAFKKHAEQAGEFNFFAQEILHTIVNCLENKDRAHYALREFVDEIEFGENLRNQGVLIKDLHADAVFSFGLAVFAEINALGLFDADGNLPYEFDNPNNDNFNDLILSPVENKRNPT